MGQILFEPDLSQWHRSLVAVYHRPRSPKCKPAGDNVSISISAQNKQIVSVQQWPSHALKPWDSGLIEVQQGLFLLSQAAY